MVELVSYLHTDFIISQIMLFTLFVMGLAIRRNPTSVSLLCDIKATEPRTVDVMDYSLTQVLAWCPRPTRVVVMCHGLSNVWRTHSRLVPDQSQYISSYFFQ